MNIRVKFLDKVRINSMKMKMFILKRKTKKMIKKMILVFLDNDIDSFLN